MQETTIKNYEILKENVKKNVTQDEYKHLISTVESIDLKGDYEKKCLLLYITYKALKQGILTH